MILGSKVVVVVPAYEEQPRIGRVLSTMPAEVDHVIVVDDASRDGTPDAARQAGDERLVVLVHEKNRGVGAAIMTGYRRALDLVRHPRDAIVVMAGDAQMDPRDLPRLVHPIARGHTGYVKGNRFAWPGSVFAMPAARWMAGKVLSALTSAALGADVNDSQCGYTAISREACARLDLERVWPGYGYPNDLLGELVRRRIAFAEVPVRPVYADEVSRLRAVHVARVLWLVARAAVRVRWSAPPPARAPTPDRTHDDQALGEPQQGGDGKKHAVDRHPERVPAGPDCA